MPAPRLTPPRLKIFVFFFFFCWCWKLFFVSFFFSLSLFFVPSDVQGYYSVSDNHFIYWYINTYPKWIQQDWKMDGIPLPKSKAGRMCTSHPQQTQIQNALVKRFEPARSLQFTKNCTHNILRWKIENVGGQRWRLVLRRRCPCDATKIWRRQLHHQKGGQFSC